MRQLLMVCAVLTMTVSPAYGQEATTVLNMAIEVRPDGDTGQCMRLPRGRVTTTLQADESRGTVPVRFLFGHADIGDSERIVTMVASEPSTHALAIRGGLYCYSLIHEGWRPPGELPRVEARRLAHYVSVTLTWQP